MKPTLLVAAAVVIREGRLLLTRRLPGAHLEGHWELPGGKIEPGETPEQALTREIHEELGVEAVVGEPFAFNHHLYPDRSVLLLAYSVVIRGEPRPLGCADIRWFDAAAVVGIPTPPADVPIFDRIRPLLRPAPS